MIQNKYANMYVLSMILCCLIASGFCAFAQPGLNDGVTPLMSAARDNEPGAFNRALKASSDISAQDVYGWTALTYSAVRGDKQMTKKLLSKHANPDIVDEDGRSILMHAVDCDRDDIVKLLIEYKADLDRRDKKGATAMGLAWAKSKDKIVALLEKAGAAPLKTEDKRANIYSPLPPYNGPFLLNFRDSMGLLLPFITSRSGELKMRVLVDADGYVRRVRVLIGLPNGGTAAAVRDAFNSRYQPATQNGRPIEVWTDRSTTIRKIM